MSSSEVTTLGSSLDWILNGFWDQYADPRSAHFYLVTGGPWKVAALVGIYLYIVYVIGPAFMKNREPYSLRTTLLWYNMLNVILNGLGFMIGMYYSRFGLDVWGCKDPKWPPIMLILGYGYMILKFVDFFDTFFFVLRKKTSQVTPLHVTHHCIMPFTAYMGLKFVPMGNTGFTPLINSFVHAVMYLYYYMAAQGPGMANVLWWKKYITRIQIAQFMLAAIHASHVWFVPGCDYPKFVSTFELIESIYFLVTFSRFYMKNYGQKAKLK